MNKRLLIPAVVTTLAASVVIGTTAAAANTKSGPTASGRAVPAAAATAAHPSLSKRQLAQIRATTASARAAAAHQPPAPLVPKLDSSLYAAARVAGAPAGPSSVQPDARGNVDVMVSGSDAAAAVRAVGGTVLASYLGQAAVTIPAARLTALAAQAGVTDVQAATPALTNDIPGAVSQGVQASGADVWQGAPLGNGGAGVDIAIVDAGFAGLSDEIANNHLPVRDDTNTTTGADVVYPSSANRCPDDQGSDHGTAVAEIVHQMAPNARLHLYCVVDNAGFFAVAGQIATAGNIKIATSSLGFVGESRGDGYAGLNSSELAVQQARRHGVLWFQSSGNTAEDHWSGTFSDKYRFDANGNVVTGADNTLDLDIRRDASNQLQLTEDDAFYLSQGETSTVTLTWDQWPTSTNTSLALQLLQLTPNPDGSTAPGCTPDYCTSALQPAISQSGKAPVLQRTVTNTLDAGLGSNGVQTILVEVDYVSANSRTAPAPPVGVHYDLTYDQQAGPSYLSYLDPAHAAAGSITSPADSPWTVAVGASYVGANPHNPEPFSSRGPTIDNRAKPDLLAYDGVAVNDRFSDLTSYQYDDQGNQIPNTLGFYGTSAAAPHAAGAAALVASANPSMDASQLEAFLEAPNDGAGTVSPISNSFGHGVLQLGAADASKVVPANGSRYHLFPQAQRIADTRSGLGVPKAPLGAVQQVTVPVPSTGPDAVPADATSVVVSVSGTAARGGTYLSIYPTSWPGNSTLNLSATDANATVTSIVRMDPATHSFKLRNAVAPTDAIITLLGYFGAPDETVGDGYVPLSPSRVLDTRNKIGVSVVAKMAKNQSIVVDTTKAGVPASADVVAVTIQALNQTAGGQLTAFPNANPAVSSLDYSKYPRANLVLVPVTNGRFTLLNRYASTDALVDVSGYFSSASPARFVIMDNPVRFVDTRTGNGGLHAMMGANTAVTEDGAGYYGVPYNATALWTGMTAIAYVAGFASVYPAGQSFPHASNLYYTGQRSVPDAAIATLSTGTAAQPPRLSTVVRSGLIDLLEDNYGYFYTPSTVSPTTK